jgi:protein-tyrosine-phosphatase
MRASRGPSDFRIWGLALGYFGFYIPYSGLTKALTQGFLPGMHGPVTGFTILPATVVATSALLLAILAATGGFRPFGRPAPGLPSVRRETLVSGIATAVIIATTTLNYTFVGISILLALLLMRGGVLIISPFVDLSTGRRVSLFSWVALGLSLAAVGVAFSDVSSYRMTVLAALNVAAYLGGYVVRLNVMSRIAKDSDPGVNRRHFREETFVAAVALVAIPALVALIFPGSIASELRAGFTGLFASRLSAPAMLIGFLYGCLYLFGTWIYLDARENTFCVPLNRCSSLLSGVVASYALAFLLGRRTPGAHELAGVAIIATALLVLMAATLAGRTASPFTPAQRVFLFVCGGNTSRSPMAQAICNAEIARRLGLAVGEMADAPVLALSAGITATPGRPLTAPSVAALRRLGVEPHDHAAREVTADLVRRAELIFCMTESQRRDLVSRFPEAQVKTRRLDPDGDIDDPSGQGDDAYHALGAVLQRLVVSSLPAMAV